MCARYIFSLLAFALFGVCGWVTFPTATPLWLAVIAVSIIVCILDYVLMFLGGILGAVLGGVIFGNEGAAYLTAFVVIGIAKYFSLFLAAKLTSLFTMPWLFGPQWLPALIITIVFLAISIVFRDRK